MASPAGLALEGGDPRLSNGLDVTDPAGPLFRKLHDPSVPFEAYLHYAKECRAWEESEPNAVQVGQDPGALFKKFFGSSKQPEEMTRVVDTPPESVHGKSHEKVPLPKTSPTQDTATGTVTITNDEWSTAARAARTATWGAVFWLLTTDILGPFSVPFVLSYHYTRKSKLLTNPLDGHSRKLDMVQVGLSTLSSVHLQASEFTAF